MKNFLPRVVSKADVFHLHQSVHAIDCRRASRLIIFQLLIQNFARALQTGDGLGNLRPDSHDLKDGSNKQAQKNVEREKGSQRHRSAQNFVRTELHDNGADDAHQPCGGKTHQRSGCKGFQNIIEQPLNPACEHALFTLLGVVTLHHANAAERFGKAARNFGVDLRPRAENRTNRREGFVDSVSENQQDAKRDCGHGHAGMNQVQQRDHRGHNPAHKLNQARANEVSHAFDVAHDA